MACRRTSDGGGKGKKDETDGKDENEGNPTPTTITPPATRHRRRDNGDATTATTMTTPDQATVGRSSDPRGLVVKICGITTAQDGLAALEAGADWLGFMRWPRSKRYLEREAAARLVAELRSRSPGPFQAVGVFVDADREALAADVAAIGLDRVQLHGGEPAAFARALPWPVLKAIRAADREGFNRQADAYDGLDLLADAFDPARPGGTGATYDHGMLEELVRRRRVIVAGGLGPDNVGAVVERLRPWGVDVSSGVESAPGRKDAALMKAFVQAARAAWPGSR
jgi:phosphoribosylanthranilate isomerase